MEIYIVAGVAVVALLVCFCLFRKKSQQNKSVRLYKTDDACHCAFVADVAAAVAAGDRAVLCTHFADSFEKMRELLAAAQVECREFFSSRELEEFLREWQSGAPLVPIVLSSNLGEVDLRRPEGAKASFEHLQEALEKAELFCFEVGPIPEVDQLLEEFAAEVPYDFSLYFYTSLESPVMSLFGSEQVGQVMERLGVTGGECLEHAFLTQSVMSAQKRTRRKMAGRFSAADSCEEWLKNNLAD